jgi:hypothetical protein
MKTFQIITLCFTSYVCSAQVVEHFNDGNFTNDPPWLGSTSHFIVNAGQQLQLNNTVAATSYLAAPFDASSIDGYEWEVYTRLSFAPSASNFGRVYLVSSQSNLAGPLNGYYLQLGEAGSNDAVELFRQSGTTHTSVCRASNAAIANAFTIRIKVARNTQGRWTIFIDYSGGTSFVEAAAGVDVSFSSSSHLGVYCTYTIGNANRFFFDDFIAGPPLGDLVPPALNSVEVDSDSTIQLVYSEALDSASVASRQHFNASDGLGEPTESWLLPDQKTVKLWFSEGFVNGKLYQLDIDSVADLAGNIAAPVSVDVRHFVPVPVTAGDIVFNELFADPSPTVGLPAQEFVELFNRSDKAINLAGWKIKDLTSVATFPSHFILPGEYLLITSSAGVVSYVPHGQTIGLPDMPTLNNSSDSFVLKDPAGLSIDSVYYQLAWYRDEDREQGGYTLERLHPEIDSNEPLNWLASESSVGGTPGKINTVFGRKLDTEPPRVDSISVVSDRVLRIWFNELMDSLSLTTLSSYVLDATGVKPTSASATPSGATLFFGESFANGFVNHLVIDSLLDTAGNSIERSRVSFLYFVPGTVKTGVILINEIMADPTPVVQLPEAEFIEIFNNTTEPFDLSGWTISDATDTALLSSSIMLPGEFIVLTSTSNAAKFNDVRVMGVPGFPSLSNSGEPLVLRSPDGQAIDSLHYLSSWFADDQKRDGGWSLERLRYELASAWNLNWRPASDSSGGTPGRINSNHNQHPDRFHPSVISLAVVNDHTLVLCFDEPVFPGVDIGQVRADSLRCIAASYPDPTRLHLTFAPAFRNGADYTLFVPAISDTALNKMPPIDLKFRFFDPKPVLQKDIVIAEIMADPVPVVGLPEAEYVELYNRSANPINLAGWQLIDAQGSTTLPETIVLPDERVTLTPLTAASGFPSGSAALGVISFPSLSSEGESLAIVDPRGTVIDSVSYNKGWYRSQEKSEGGWSLELIDPDNLCGEEDNWVASESTTGGTPGMLNSVDANKPDLKGPRLLNLELKENSIVATFNERLEKSFSDVIVQLSPSSGKCTARAFDSGLRRIELAFEEKLKSSTEYFIQITNLRDCSGNEIDPAFASAKFAVPEDPEPGDVLISEILFNPFSGGVDFIEVYNRSQKYINLSGWKLARAETGVYDDQQDIAASILRPNSFLVFTMDPLVLKSHYPRSIDDALLKTTLPSLPDDEAAVVILDRNGKAADSVAYSEDMHADMISDPEGISLERISFDGSSSESSNWRSANEGAGFATPGFINSNSRSFTAEEENSVVISPEIISPYGANNFALIEYNLIEGGNYVNCRVVDQRGRAIKELAQNVSVGSQGFFRWDGDDDAGQLVIPAYYVVYFEYFDLDGNVRVVRKRVIVAPR